MTSRTRRKHNAQDEALTGEALVEAQQAMLRSPDAPRGYMGRGTPEEQDAQAERMAKVVNPKEHEGDAPRRGVRPAMIGRDPDADVEYLEEGDAATNRASRVGFIPVQHPRARTASALHDFLGERKPNDLTVDELTSAAEDFGLNVEGTGANSAPLKADFVRAMDDLLADYPRQVS